MKIEKNDILIDIQWLPKHHWRREKNNATVFRYPRAPCASYSCKASVTQPEVDWAPLFLHATSSLLPSSHEHPKPHYA